MSGQREREIERERERETGRQTDKQTDGVCMQWVKRGKEKKGKSVY